MVTVSIVLSVFAFIFSNNQKNNNNTDTDYPTQTPFPTGQYVTQQQLTDNLKNYTTTKDLQNNYTAKSDLKDYIKNDDNITITGRTKCSPTQKSCGLEDNPPCTAQLTCAFAEAPTAAGNLNAVFSEGGGNGRRLKINKD